MNRQTGPLDGDLLAQARAAVVRAELARCARLRAAIAGDACVGVDAEEQELAVRRLLRLDRAATAAVSPIAAVAASPATGGERLVLFAIAALAHDGVAVIGDRQLARATRLPVTVVLEHVRALQVAGELGVYRHAASGLPVYELGGVLAGGAW